jgi:hypothetical protein
MPGRFLNPACQADRPLALPRLRGAPTLCTDALPGYRDHTCVIRSKQAWTVAVISGRCAPPSQTGKQGAPPTLQGMVVTPVQVRISSVLPRHRGGGATWRASSSMIPTNPLSTHSRAPA